MKENQDFVKRDTQANEIVCNKGNSEFPLLRSRATPGGYINRRCASPRKLTNENCVYQEQRQVPPSTKGVRGLIHPRGY